MRHVGGPLSAELLIEEPLSAVLLTTQQYSLERKSQAVFAIEATVPVRFAFSGSGPRHSGADFRQSGQ